jgi:hypothetical protein
MSVERIFYCDWYDCETHTRTIGSRPGMSFLTVEEDADHTLHFCSWDCLLKHAASMPPLVEVVSLHE